jgi:hypothetical protein
MGYAGSPDGILRADTVVGWSRENHSNILQNIRLTHRPIEVIDAFSKAGNIRSHSATSIAI